MKALGEAGATEIEADLTARLPSQNCFAKFDCSSGNQEGHTSSSVWFSKQSHCCWSLRAPFLEQHQAPCAGHTEHCDDSNLECCDVPEQEEEQEAQSW